MHIKTKKTTKKINPHTFAKSPGGKFGKNSEKGVSLYVMLVITSILLAMTFGLETLLVGQLKGMREIGNSTIALFGSDSGMERTLYLNAICQQSDCYSSTTNPNFYSLCCDQIKKYYSTTSCEGLPCIGLYDYSASSSLGEFSIPDLSYDVNVTTTLSPTTTYFYSRGIFKGSQREIKASSNY